VKTPIDAAAQLAITTLTKQAPAASELAKLFKIAGFKLALVGGPVRDAILGRLGNDLDFTTDAHPKDSEKILNKWADSVWDIGAAFGTVAGKKDEITVEITTYRSESYDPTSRKPDVEFGKSIEADLARRDFTINAMALELTTEEPTFIDLFNGVVDLQKKIIKTPGKPEDSFSDDPLRMMRAARFMSQLNFEVDQSVLVAIKNMAARLEIISAERIRDEFIKIMMSPSPRLGITLLVETGLADYFLPEVPKLKLEIDEHHHHKDVYEHSLTVLEL
jgi:poly(A) polymerase